MNGVRLRLVIALFFVCSLIATRASAQRSPPRSMADTLPPAAAAVYKSGRLLFEDGDYAGALVQFQAAFDQSHDARLYWNLAACEKGMRHYARALELLAKYRGQASLDKNDARDADELSAALVPFTIAVTFRANEAGADVYVDDARVGTTPMSAPVLVDIGTRRFRVTKSGFRDFERTLRVGKTRAMDFDATLVPRASTLRITTAAGATVLVDGRAIGTGAAEAVLAPGVHTLTVQAPGMKTFETPVALEDEQTRTIDVELEPRPMTAVHPVAAVSVGCGNAQPLGPERGLKLYVDGVVETPVAVRHAGLAVESVVFAVERGPHALRVRIPACDSLEIHADVREDETTVEGALRDSRGVIWRGPAGTPDGWRLGLALWRDALRTPSTGGHPFDPVTLNGLIVSGALVGRWLGGYADLGLSTGGMTYADTRQATSGTRLLARARFGPRLPLNLAAISAGVGLGAGGLIAGGTNNGSFVLTVWSAIDLQPFCDWVIPLGLAINSGAGDGGGAPAVELGIAYQPSRVCRDERSTAFGLKVR
jgi:hypothetical protein